MVGHNEGSTLTKFRDFNSNLYSPDITPQIVTSEIPTQSGLTHVASPVKVSIVNADYVYFGEVRDGKRHGKGECKFKGGKLLGDMYDGEWENDKRNGHGVMKYADGDVYDGEFRDDKKHGHGVFKYADGGVYDGEWKDGEKLGR